MRSQHEIFHTPHEVALTITQQRTPDAYRKYVSETTMPMWRVQTEGYTEGNKQLIGLVSRDKGFLDSPDTEWISSGVNSKNPDAVAIGRHGNFFLWGFAASPTYLTEEAKTVFVNAVHYIRKFDRQAPIARKRPGTALRSSIEFALASMSDEGYAERLKSHEVFVAEDAKRVAAIRARIAAGEQVSKFDRQMLDRRPMRKPGRFEYIRRYVPKEEWSRLDGDVAAVTAWFADRLPYMYPSGWYELVIDEELRELGVGNDDVRMLDKAIATWEAGGDAKAMRRILMRYTDQSFEASGQWREWLRTNRAKLFYTEAGGFKWLVDTVGRRKAPRAAEQPAPAGASSAATPAAGAAKRTPLQPTAENPLAAAMQLRALASGEVEVVVSVAIFEGWHAYDSVAEGSPYTVLTPTLTLPKEVARVRAWQRPEGKAYPADPNVQIFDGAFTLRCRLQGCTADNVDEVVCKLSYQVCDDNMCQAPTSVRLTVDAASVFRSR